jgi:hypothetical protein
LLDKNKKEESKEGSDAIGPVHCTAALGVRAVVLISDCCRSQPTTEPAEL